MIWRRTFHDIYRFRLAPLISGRLDALDKKSKELFYKALVVSLTLVILLFQAFKRLDLFVAEPIELSASDLIFIEDVPITRQEIKQPPPPRPVVPIPTDDPSIPEDLTIEETELDLLPLPPIAALGSAGVSITPPRPIAEVFPEYPSSEKKRGIEGEIELALLVDEDGMVQNVQTVKNSTSSEACERSAVQAAYQTRFIPAKRKNIKVSVWIHKIYKFGLN